MKLFLDSDGVCAAFDENVFKRFGRYPRQMRDPEMWAKINSDPDFWPSMPLIPGCEALWTFAKPFNPIILTGCPRSNYELAASHKVAWWKRHFDHDAVITCLSRDKAMHMSAPGDILVDDMVKNIKRWTDAGGVGILHRGDYATTIAAIQTAMAARVEAAHADG